MTTSYTISHPSRPALRRPQPALHCPSLALLLVKRSRPFPHGSCFKCRDKDHKKEECWNLIKCFRCRRFGHRASSCKQGLTDSSNHTERIRANFWIISFTPAKKMTPGGSPSPPTRMAGSGTHKAFITTSSDMEEMQHYLQRAAYVEVYGRQIKEDDVQDILARK